MSPIQTLSRHPPFAPNRLAHIFAIDILGGWERHDTLDGLLVDVRPLAEHARYVMSSRNPRGGAQLGFPPLARSALIILIVNVAVWATTLVLFYASPETFETVQRLFVLDTNRVLDGYVYQLATYMFFHDVGSPFHIMFNMLLVYFFAHALEDEWGLKKTLWFT